MTPPPTRRDTVVDVLHGRSVADPYRWLEDGDDPEVAAWVAAQNRHTRQALDRPERTGWHERLVALMGRPVLLAAQVRGEHLVCLERLAGAEQAVLTRRPVAEPTAPPVVLLDPAAGTADAAAAVDWFSVGPDGALVAVGTSEGGTEESVLRVVDAGDGTDLGESIPDTRAASVAWEPDGDGFFYTRYPAGDQYHRSVHHHRLGTDWHDDPVVWSEHPTPEAWPDVDLGPDGRFLLVHVMVGWSRTDGHVLDRTTGEWLTLIEGVEAVSAFRFAADPGRLVAVTTLDAPRGRLVELALSETDPAAWRTLVPESEDVLGHLAVAAGDVWVTSTRRAVDSIRRFGADGTPFGPVEGLPPLVAVAGLTADRDTGAAYAVIDAFDAPTTAWRLPGPESDPEPDPELDAACARSDVPDRDARPCRTGGDGGGPVAVALTVTQTTYPSLDDTEIGLFLLHRPDVAPGPDVPLILNGYGGFAIAETPVWSPQIVAWCQAGGAYAIAGLRGGCEEGEAWHDAGRRRHKQNVFDDFHAAADWLVAGDLASRERLAVLGRSNGGLLVGAALTQRPDLCRAVWCAVPLLDMVRFPRFLIARLWTAEYGDPDVPEEFEWLFAYSPYHRVVDGTCYPATLFTTAEGDTRVDPLHARKMAALVQTATSCGEDRPILLYQEERSGHGVGKPVHKRADELADGLTFLAGQLGLTPPAPT